MRLFPRPRQRTIRQLCDKPKQKRRSLSHYRPQLEALEDRCLLSAGALDPTFGSGGIVTNDFGPATESQGAAAVAIYPNAGTANDGKIVAVGDAPTTMQHSNYVDSFAVARYGANGTLDSSFGGSGKVTTPIGSGNARANDVAIQTDGKIVAAGFAVNSSGKSEFAVARYNLNGSLDSTFGSGKSAGIVQTNMSRSSSDYAESMALQADGKIVVAGLSSGQFAVVRYNTNGSLDTTFNGSGKILTNFSGSAYGTPFNSSVDVAIYPASSTANAGKIVVVGLLQNANGTYSVAVLRYNPDGSPDSTFGGGTGYVILNTPGVGKDSLPHVAIQSDDRLDVAFTNDAGNWEMSIARLQANGALDPSFGAGGIVTTNHQMTDRADSLALQADGRIVVAGTEGLDRVDSLVVARFNTDGSLDATFGTNGFQTAAATLEVNYSVDVAIQPDGRIVAAATQELASSNGGNTFAFALARFLPSEPEIGSFTANQTSAGAPVALTASSITDGNPNYSITLVTFYYYDLTGNKVVLGTVTASDGSGNWTLDVTLLPGTYTLYAQAQDSYGVFGDPTALVVAVA